ncbi:MAG: DUF3090 family protein [Actinobacteria bacterium]|nr:DUF3090 family protein [Actinomycetota bacterium]
MAILWVDQKMSLRRIYNLDEVDRFILGTVGQPGEREFYIPSQARSFIDRASNVIKAGRPPCMFCGAPINPDGHICPRMN